MKLIETEDFLKQFDYKYIKNNNELIVIMAFSQRVSIDFSNPDKIVITDQLKGWNFLTGIINTSIKKAILLTLIIGAITSYGISFYNSETSIFIFFAMFLWTLLWSSYYLSKSENLKDTLLNWNS